MFHLATDLSIQATAFRWFSNVNFHLKVWKHQLLMTVLATDASALALQVVVNADPLFDELNHAQPLELRGLCKRRQHCRRLHMNLHRLITLERLATNRRSLPCRLLTRIKLAEHLAEHIVSVLCALPSCLSRRGLAAYWRPSY